MLFSIPLFLIYYWVYWVRLIDIKCKIWLCIKPILDGEIWRKDLRYIISLRIGWTKWKETKALQRIGKAGIFQVRSGLIRNSRIPLYSSKFSKKDLQLAPIIEFHSVEKILVKRLLLYLRINGKNDWDQMQIDLDSLPHLMTLHKISQWINSCIFRLLNRLIALFYYWGRISSTAMDSYGFTSSYTRSSYSWRTGKIWKHFLKTFISIDTDCQIITGLKISQQPVPDILQEEKILVQCHTTRKSNAYVLEKDTILKLCTY
jgi:hypothetical protein